MSLLLFSSVLLLLVSACVDVEGLLSLAIRSSTIGDPLVVQTEAGLVEGIRIPYVDDATSIDIYAWLSVPFAKPPVGSLRWRESEKADPWDGTLSCKALLPSCIQSNAAIDGYSEDCLHLSVYTNANPSDEGPYPVLFYIYGGALLFGSATENMTSFMTHAGKGKGVVVVEVNYRLNIFGFLASSELSQEQGGASGNYGFSDQLLALEWVQANIAKFGGDPNRVTIAGQSSGGTSVFALLSSPRSKKLFHRAISLSGSPNITMSLEQAEAQNADIIVESGCKIDNNTSATDTLSCMRSLSEEKLVSLVPNSWYTPGLWDLPKSERGQNYAGLAIVDGRIVTMPFDEAISSGLIDVPLMMGNMQFEPDEYPGQDVSVLSDQQWHDKLVESFSSFTNSSTANLAIAEEIYKRYLPFSRENPQKAFDAFVTDYGVYCPSISLAKKFKSPTESSYRSDLYVYINQWNLSSALVNEEMYTVRYAFHYLDFIFIKEDWNLYTYSEDVASAATKVSSKAYPPRVRREMKGVSTSTLTSTDSRSHPNSTVGIGSSGATDTTKFEPQESDLRGAQFLQSVWFDFMSTGSVSASTNSSWRPVGANAGWPRKYEMYVIDPKLSQEVSNHRSEFCDYFSSIGLDNKKFWWVN